MKKINRKVKMSYEPEADVLRIESGNGPIAYATEIGDTIVHFSPDDMPVYVEILEASKFLKQASTLLRAPLRRSLVSTRA